MKIEVESKVVRSPRVIQMEGMFEVSPSESTHLEWDVNLPLGEREWQIGLVVGPSGSGKTTVARGLWPQHLSAEYGWIKGRSLLDSFPTMPTREIVELLNSVGFSSPPSWVRPYEVLSTGEQFRVNVARALSEARTSEYPPLVVLDEFTSVVDRTVAQVGSSAIAKTVRRYDDMQLVAVTCHYDVEDWLSPDWVYEPATNTFRWRLVRPRPPIELKIGRVHHDAWRMFRRHHYLDTNLNVSAACFVAYWNDRPVCFSSWLAQPHGQIHNLRREHRTVTLPDYQGVGIGNAVSAYLASMWKALGFRATSTTSHPSMVHSRAKSPLWRMHRAPSRTTGGGMMARDSTLRFTIANNRLTAGFEYIGPAMDRAAAKELHGG